ncbi:hypothetical protein YC2023_068273 [Brassica napus]
MEKEVGLRLKEEDEVVNYTVVGKKISGLTGLNGHLHVKRAHGMCSRALDGHGYKRAWFKRVRVARFNIPSGRLSTESIRKLVMPISISSVSPYHPLVQDSHLSKNEFKYNGENVKTEVIKLGCSVLWV